MLNILGRWRNWIIWLGILFCVFTLSGCFVPIPFASPKISMVSGRSAGANVDKVYAFRMDIRDWIGSPCFCTEKSKSERCIMRRVRINKKGQIPSQLKLSMTTGVIWHCIALDYTHYEVSRILMRVYRPGYETVVWSDGDKGQIKWHSVETLFEQERAVDRLFSTWDTGCECSYLELWSEWDSKYGTEGDWREIDEVSQTEFWEVAFCCLAGGSASKSHRDALLFGASEYRRIASEATDKNLTDLQLRCIEKAEWFSKLASE